MKIKFLSNKVIKAGVGYTIGNYLLKGIGFITIPIFSRLLSTADFGIYNTFMAYEGILYLFVGLALHMSIKNAKYKYGEKKIDEYTSSISLIPIFVALFYLIIANLLLPWIQGSLRLSRTYINLLLLYSLCSSLLYIYQNRLVLDYKTGKYLILSYFNALSSVALSIFFIVFVFKKEKYMGRILGSLLPMIIIAFWIQYQLFKLAKPKIRKEYFQYSLKISLPIIPHGIGQVILSSFDRIMITNMVSASASGLYSFAYTIYSIILVAGNSISTVFEPWAYERLNANDKESLQKRGGQFIILLSYVSALAMLLSPELVWILGSKKYVDAIPAITPVLFGGFFAMAYTIPSIIEYYKEKTKYIAVGTITAAIINIITNLLFIPKYGYLAAAYTTLFSYILYYFFHTIVAKKLLGYYIISPKMNCIAIIQLAAMALISIACRNIIWARYLAVLVIFGLCIISFLKIYKKE